MKNYIITLVGVALLSGAIQIIAPEGETKKYINLLAGLCAVCVVIAPFGSVIKALASKDGGYFDKVLEAASEQSDYESIYLENFKIHGAESLAEGLEEMISEEFGIKRENFSVTARMTYAENLLGVERITVYLKPAAIFADPHAIKDYVNTLLGCPCDIVYA